MTDKAKIPLDAARGPRPAMGDVTVLADLVEVDEILARALLDGREKLAAVGRRDEQFEVGVLQPDDVSLLADAVEAELVKEVIGVEARSTAPHAGAGHDGRWIRSGERIYLEGLLFLLDRCLLGRKTRSGGQRQQ